MKNLRIWLASESGKRFFNVAYSLGAAIVIIGAMFKVMHFPGANVIFVTGMVVEALIFFLSAFDTSLYDNTPITVGQNIQMSDGLLTNKSVNTQHSIDNQKVQEQSAVKSVPASGGASVIVVGGTHGNPSSSTVSDGKIYTEESISAEEAKGYSESMANAALNMEEFSKTMQSLNETSQTLLNAYKQIADANSLSESMNTVRYINDSLSRIKNLYDGAIGDSYMFKEEMSKMTRHIEALNQVYARLLQAMTNNNSNPNNPPIY